MSAPRATILRPARRARARLWGLGAGLGLGLGLLWGCGAEAIPLGEICPEVECLDAFEVSFEREAAWAPGDYEVEVALDDQVFSCPTVLPPACDAPPACPEDSGLELMRSDCEAPAALFGVKLAQGATPAAVRVSVRLEGDLLASKNFTPDYETTQPAGRGCFPFCDTAEPETLTVE